MNRSLHRLIHSLATSLYTKTIHPRSIDTDLRRRESVLNILLAGLTTIGLIAILASLWQIIVSPSATLSSMSFTFVFWSFIVGLWYASRRGHFRFSAYVLISLVWLAALQLLLTWGVALPQVLLMFSLSIVMAGVLINSYGAISVTVLTVAVLLIGGYLQYTHIIVVNTDWTAREFVFSDAIGYGIVLMIIGLVSWLSNRETHSLLKRAQVSERALIRERNSLERKVVQRTKQLEQAQRQRLMELQRFADFGRFSGGIFHDLAQPLTVATLSLEQLGQHERSALVRDAMRSLNQLERYIVAAQKQLRDESQITRFPIKAELDQVRDILSYKARQAGITLDLTCPNYRLTGDPIKFSQLAANLIANAIDAYPPASKQPDKRVITIRVIRQGTTIRLSVHDWGSGISPHQTKQIFDPFFSTKKAGIHNRNIGIGLTTARSVAEEAFGGSLTVSSSTRLGTRFVAVLHNAPATV